VLWFLPAAGVEGLKPYQTARLTGFTSPDADPSGLTYNVNQSITAVGSGGLEGRGVSADTLAQGLRTGAPAVIARIHDDAVLLDLRTVLDDERDELVAAVVQALSA